MSARAFPDTFAIALSYAGEQIDLVRPLAEALERKLGPSSVFFDKWFEHVTAGEGRDAMLQKIYWKRSRLAVVCVSGDYERKPWTQNERKAIQARRHEALGLTPGPLREAADLAVIDLRVGDGDTGLVLPTTITIDLRAKGPDTVAQLLCDRLALIDDYLRRAAAAAAVPAPAVDPWPASPLPVVWPMADHLRVLEAFAAMVQRGSAQRLLLVRGEEGLGKTWLLQSMHDNAMVWDGIRVGLLDARNTADPGPAMATWAQSLAVAPPAPGSAVGPALGRIFEQLRGTPQPTLLLVDAFERAAPDLQLWLQTQLLPAAMRAPWLRVVVAGVHVPDPQSAVWSIVCGPVQTLTRPTPADWHRWCRERLQKDLPLAEIEVLCRYITAPGKLAEALSNATAA